MYIFACLKFFRFVSYSSSKFPKKFHRVAIFSSLREPLNVSQNISPLPSACFFQKDKMNNEFLRSGFYDGFTGLLDGFTGLLVALFSPLI
jgi:hypothetical protein